MKGVIVGWIMAVAWVAVAASGAGTPGTVASAASSPGGGTGEARGAAWQVIGISPFLDRADKDAVYRQVVGFALEGVPPGGVLRLIDAYRVRTIAVMEVPNTRASMSAKARAVRFQGELRTLKAFLAEEAPMPRVAGVAGTGAVRLPQFLEFVAADRGDRERAGRVLVLGNPLYLDEREPAFAMADGLYPTDGHLVATRERSVFGRAESGDPLREVTVHMAYFGTPWRDGVHEDRVRRFWRLYVAGRGGRWGLCAGDLPAVFAAFRREDAAGDDVSLEEALDDSRTVVAMRRGRREVMAVDWLMRDLGPAGSAGAPVSVLGPMKIGIRWHGDVDLDLYARPDAEGTTLSFSEPRSGAGYHYKDHRSSPDREYEFIEFEVPVDVRRVEAAVNFYSGEVGEGLTGEARIEFEGRVYSAPFTIPARAGNRGRGGPGQEDYWARLDVAGMMGLR
ncbi:MAG: hypothetical protein KF833_14255 [Verrucomicrobiae bacterium]|nr:hypothetical protein [Verrucomicrobiae bacterium]